MNVIETFKWLARRRPADSVVHGRRVQATKGFGRTRGTQKPIVHTHTHTNIIRIGIRMLCTFLRVYNLCVHKYNTYVHNTHVVARHTYIILWAAEKRRDI